MIYVQSDWRDYKIDIDLIREEIFVRHDQCNEESFIDNADDVYQFIDNHECPGSPPSQKPIDYPEIMDIPFVVVRRRSKENPFKSPP